MVDDAVLDAICTVAALSRKASYLSMAGRKFKLASHRQGIDRGNFCKKSLIYSVVSVAFCECLNNMFIVKLLLICTLKLL